MQENNASLLRAYQLSLFSFKCGKILVQTKRKIDNQTGERSLALTNATQDQNLIKSVWFERRRNRKLYANSLRIPCPWRCSGTMGFENFAIGVVSEAGFKPYDDPRAEFTGPHDLGPKGNCSKCHKISRVSNSVLAEVMRRAEEFVSK